MEQESEESDKEQVAEYFNKIIRKEGEGFNFESNEVVNDQKKSKSN